MNILECTIKFQEMEMSHGLFELKTFDGIYFWDIVRYDVFYFIFRDNLNDKPKPNKVIPNKSNRSKITEGLKNLVGDFKYLHKNTGKKYLFLKCSRNLINDKETDIISADYLKIIGEDCFVIEIYGNSTGKNSFLNSVLRYKKKINILFKKKAENYDIDKVINNTFKLDLHLDDFIASRVENFRIERSYYRKLLKKLKPKAAFFVQDSSQKALVYCCRELGKPSIELQHGIINNCHQGYSYPKAIEKYNENEVVVPEVLFAFSDYWINNVNYPVREAIAMGNTYYSIPNCATLKNDKEITFISADIYEAKIEVYLDYLLEKEADFKINLKLHPNQKGQIDEIAKKYSKYKNVKVYYNEINLHELFKTSKVVVLVTSTAAYEAIQFGCCVGIIRDDASFDIEDLFHHENVIVLDNPKDLFNKDKKEIINTVFFDEFSQENMKSFIKSIQG